MPTGPPPITRMSVSRETSTLMEPMFQLELSIDTESFCREDEMVGWDVLCEEKMGRLRGNS